LSNKFTTEHIKRLSFECDGNIFDINDFIKFSDGSSCGDVLNYDNNAIF